MIAWRSYLIPVLVSLTLGTARADIEGKVVAVTDGDTVKVLDAANVLHKVRMTGIDAPEKGQPFGNASRNYLASLLAGKIVLVESSKVDRYGRTLGKVWVEPPDCPECGKTLDVNHAQIIAGMAWWYKHYAAQQPAEDRERYKSAVNQARQGKLGLWAEPNPVPPWAWRRGQRTPTVNRVPIEFECGSKRYCREMASCDEAKYYLQKCGLSRLDGDRDGVPCESLCR
jgi:endonuclease YncB( thermonuclease family)